MKTKQINPALWIGLVGMLTIGSSYITDLYRAFLGNRDIWWTPQTMRLPVEATKNHFELYIAGKSLQNHLSDGTLFSVDKNGERYPIVSKDVTVRLNNWDQVKGSILTGASITGFVSGAMFALLLIGLIRAFYQRDNSS